jgi:hypothetical protein
MERPNFRNETKNNNRGSISLKHMNEMKKTLD